MRRIVSILSAGIRFRAMRARRASSLFLARKLCRELDAKLSLLLIVEATNAVRVGPREAKSLFLIPERHQDEVAVRRGS